MKFKEIKNNTVIHCPKEDDVKRLADYLNLIKNDMLGFWQVYKDETCFRIICGSTFLYGKKRSFLNDGYNVIECSDLLEPKELSGKEIIEWFDKYSREIENMQDLFPHCNTITDVVENYTPEYIMEKISWYENEKEKRKHLNYVGGLEWVNFVKVISCETDECVHTEEIENGIKKEPTQKILTKYMQEHDGEYYAVVERRCRKISYEN